MCVCVADHQTVRCVSQKVTNPDLGSDVNAYTTLILTAPPVTTMLWTPPPLPGPIYYSTPSHILPDDAASLSL